MARTHRQNIEFFRLFMAVIVSVLILVSWFFVMFIMRDADETGKKILCGAFGTVIGYWIR